jgi:hypothetical protein
MGYFKTISQWFKKIGAFYHIRKKQEFASVFLILTKISSKRAKIINFISLDFVFAQTIYNTNTTWI